ncbi:hypothetical protein [Pseudonocardia humida]|uniref:Uncharacterized protein n=1 Tax=Pseudonocardia humida TaxID=2800819 RepID=A0ABT0ZVF4_9PSEU|nr:hypothetical protein [Pseudonocardia humida]MCO1654714.1 hypothetical protein [Pseudonocardia humida]
MTDPEDALRAALRDPDLDAVPPTDLLAGVLRRRDRLRRRRQRLATGAAAVAAVAVLGGVTAAVAAATGGYGTVVPADRPDPPVPAPTTTGAEPIPASPAPSVAPGPMMPPSQPPFVVPPPATGIPRAETSAPAESTRQYPRTTTPSVEATPAG